MVLCNEEIGDAGVERAVPARFWQRERAGDSAIHLFPGRGAELLEQRAEVRVLFEDGSLHDLLHGFASFPALLGGVGGFHFFASGNNFGIILGFLPRGFQLLALLGGERFEPIAHAFGAVAGLLHFFQNRREAGICGEEGGIHRLLELLVERIAGLFERADGRIFLRFFAGGTETTGFLRWQATGGAIRTAMLTVLFPIRFAGWLGSVRLVGLSLRAGSVTDNECGAEGAEKHFRIHNNGFNPGRPRRLRFFSRPTTEEERPVRVVAQAGQR